jgi:hypothetical protein
VKREQDLISYAVRVGEKGERARICLACIGQQVADGFGRIVLSFRIVVADEFDCAEPILLVQPKAFRS